MKITWLGTASIRVEAAGERLLFDPFVQLAGGENPNRIEDFLEDDTIWITHGHFDHLMETPVILEDETAGEATVFCGSVAADTLSGLMEDTGNVVLVRPGMTLCVGAVRVRVWEGKHASPGLKRTVRTFLLGLRPRYWRNALAMLWLHLHFPEKGQTLLYEVCAEQKRVLVMGSLGLRPDPAYPKGADLLILPYQGSAHLEDKAMEIIRRLSPKRVLLDHFDDAYPPVTQRTDTRGLKKRMQRECPQILCIKPTAGKTVTL